MPSLTLTALDGVPEIRPGQPLDEVLYAALERTGLELADGDVVVLCQKIVSKSENRFVTLAEVRPSEQAQVLAARCEKDPALVELILQESDSIVRCLKDVLIVRHRLGFVVANAAIDQSNIEESEDQALLLPADPDASAARLRDAIATRLGRQVAVIISDSFGRPWRQGVTGVCIGCAGLDPLVDMRGRLDRFGRALKVTQIAAGDEIAAAAALLTGEADEGRPIIVVRGVSPDFLANGRSARHLVRPIDSDLFQ
jgi:coenzyme F420-0:L-glutamate ligase/coenzyme F420-1:gamma-L-glutamate ligase